ncbi:hypothetical protein GCM10007978_49830 [Shewanella hanedai]|uniref:Uncharacterized protein n=1 Tax=Shewanella hanedai TaxID=25 RepID=A0A553JB35_SHEHA|nr:hypothetical protein [Shewanella hanedai]TRY09677.1 hypothetical protein FN961_25615 [Shewanella hanedai]GGJ06302.1 hypothetical protein GCM10007978_49830 [Shewanella hanedai]
MRKIKLMTDYDCYPLWEEFSDGVDNIAPSSLPISESLATRIDAWGDEYDKTMNREDPATSGFCNEQALVAFEEEGEMLFAELKQELSEEFAVTYFSTHSNSLKS